MLGLQITKRQGNEFQRLMPRLLNLTSRWAIEESDNSWTFDSDSGVAIESNSVTDIESGASIDVNENDYRLWRDDRTYFRYKCRGCWWSGRGSEFFVSWRNGIIRLTDNSWTLDTYSGVMVKSVSITGFETMAAIDVDVGVTNCEDHRFTNISSEKKWQHNAFFKLLIILSP